MNIDLKKKARGSTTKQQMQISLHSFWVGLAAFGCAYLMETEEVNFTYPLEVFLKGVIADNAIIDDHLYKIKL